MSTNVSNVVVDTYAQPIAIVVVLDAPVEANAIATDPDVMVQQAANALESNVEQMMKMIISRIPLL